MQQSGKVGAGRHPNAREWLFDGASAPDSFTALEHEHPQTRAGQVSGARQPVVTSPDHDHIPGTRGDFLEWRGDTDLSQDCCCCRHTGSIYARLAIAKKKLRALKVRTAELPTLSDPWSHNPGATMLPTLPGKSTAR